MSVLVREITLDFLSLSSSPSPCVRYEMGQKDGWNRRTYVTATLLVLYPSLVSTVIVILILILIVTSHDLSTYSTCTCIYMTMLVIIISIVILILWTDSDTSSKDHHCTSIYIYLIKNNYMHIAFET